MALITNLIHTNNAPTARTSVVADYSFSGTIFQIRTYKEGDTSRVEGQKQNIEIDKEMASKIVGYLKEFIG